MIGNALKFEKLLLEIGFINVMFSECIKPVQHRPCTVYLTISVKLLNFEAKVSPWSSQLYVHVKEVRAVMSHNFHGVLRVGRHLLEVI